MENGKKILNDFVKSKFADQNELKKALFQAGVAALDEGWTFMDATFQLGGKARGGAGLRLFYDYAYHQSAQKRRALKRRRRT